MEYPPALAHGEIRELFPDVFIVTGAMEASQNGTTRRFSRNMVVVREGESLVVVNSLLLDEDGLDDLECLGSVTKLVTLGAAHNRDDEFYLDRWGAEYWLPEGLPLVGPRPPQILEPGGEMPLRDASFLSLPTSGGPEGILLLEREGGIAIVCNLLTNWTGRDEYFDEDSAEAMNSAGLLSGPVVPRRWLEDVELDATSLAGLELPPFQHLLPAHGLPIEGNADAALASAVAAATNR